jgi:hypothetical protein
MTHIHPARLARQERRWLRNDAHRWLRPDHARFEKPQQIEHKYNPDQPRVSAGNPNGGQWTSGSGAGLMLLPFGLQIGDQLLFEDFLGPDWSFDYAEELQLAQLEGILDAEGNPYYRPGGHHEMPRGIYGQWNLSDETRRVFERSTTGTIPRMLLRTTPDGVPQGHFWSGRDGPHGQYNAAIKELGDAFLERNQIRPDQMTPDHARAILREVRESSDPRIRQFNDTMRLLRRLFPLRGGRGTE